MDMELLTLKAIARMAIAEVDEFEDAPLTERLAALVELEEQIDDLIVEIKHNI